MSKSKNFLKKNLKNRCGGRFLADRQELIGGWTISPTFLNYIRTDIYKFNTEVEGEDNLVYTPSLEDIELVILMLKERGLLYPGIEEVR